MSVIGDTGASVVGFRGAGDILQLFTQGKLHTKSDLARLTGLSRSTVAVRVDALLAAGLLRPVGEASSTGGRPPAQLALNPLAHTVLAVDVGATHCRVAVCDLHGNTLHTIEGTIEVAAGPLAVLGWAAEAARRCIEAAGEGSGRPLALGIGIPAPVDHSTGRLNHPPHMPGWDDFDVPAFFAEQLEIHALVDNDVNMLALGERAAIWPDVDDLLFVKVATGIGAGIISGGMLQRGGKGVAGNIGNARVRRDQGSHETGEDDPALFEVAAGKALVNLLRERGRTLETTAELTALLVQGDAEVVSEVRRAGRTIGEVLATAVDLLNPTVIVVGGSIGSTGEHLLAGLREVVYRRSTPLASQDLLITSARAGVRAGLIGAARLAIEYALAPERIEQILREH